MENQLVKFSFHSKSRKVNKLLVNYFVVLQLLPVGGHHSRSSTYLIWHKFYTGYPSWSKVSNFIWAWDQRVNPLVARLDPRPKNKNPACSGESTVPCCWITGGLVTYVTNLKRTKRIYVVTFLFVDVKGWEESLFKAVAYCYYLIMVVGGADVQKRILLKGLAMYTVIH